MVDGFSALFEAEATSNDVTALRQRLLDKFFNQAGAQFAQSIISIWGSAGGKDGVGVRTELKVRACKALSACPLAVSYRCAIALCCVMPYHVWIVAPSSHAFCLRRITPILPICLAWQVLQKTAAQKIAKENPLVFEPTTDFLLPLTDMHVRLRFLLRFSPKALEKKTIRVGHLQALLVAYAKEGEKPNLKGKRVDLVERVRAAITAAGESPPPRVPLLPQKVPTSPPPEGGMGARQGVVEGQVPAAEGSDAEEDAVAEGVEAHEAGSDEESVDGCSETGDVADGRCCVRRRVGLALLQGPNGV